MNYKVQLTETAENDLRGIFEYIAFDLQSIQNAAGQLDRLEQSIISLNHMPERFRVYEKSPAALSCRGGFYLYSSLSSSLSSTLI